MILHAVGSLNDVSTATCYASSPQGSTESGRVMNCCWAGRWVGASVVPVTKYGPEQ